MVARGRHSQALGKFDRVHVPPLCHLVWGGLTRPFPTMAGARDGRRRLGISRWDDTS